MGAGPVPDLVQVSERAVTHLCSLPAVFNNPRVQGKKTVLEKLGEVVDVLKKGGSGSDHAQQLAAVLFLTRLVEGTQEKNATRSDSAQTVR